MKKRSQVLETVVHGVFLLLGLITVGCVLLISVYLIVSGIPAIRQIGLVPFLFGKTWASTAAEPSYGILPFILTSVYGTAGAIVLGVPLGFLTAVYLAKVAPPRLKTVLESAVSLLAGIPSVVYGLVGMLVLVPGIRKVFHLADGASLLAAIIVLAIMILPSIIKVSVTALEAVDKDLSGGDVGGHRDVVDIAQAQQSHLIRLAGLCVDGVAEEQQQVHLVAGDAGRDLLVAALYARQKALHLQTGGFGDHLAGRTGCHQFMLAQNPAVRRTELYHQLFFGVMRNQCNRHRSTSPFPTPLSGAIILHIS